MSNRLGPDQARRFLGPDLGPDCLARLSADGTGRKRVKQSCILNMLIICPFEILFGVTRKYLYILFLFLYFLITICNNVDTSTLCLRFYEPSHEKTCFLHMRKQRLRSVGRYPRS